jgi:hypothetical protein
LITGFFQAADQIGISFSIDGFIHIFLDAPEFL